MLVLAQRGGLEKAIYSILDILRSHFDLFKGALRVVKFESKLTQRSCSFVGRKKPCEILMKCCDIDRKIIEDDLLEVFFLIQHLRPIHLHE